VASPAGATASADLNAGTIQLGNFAIPATGGWQNWTTVSRTVTLNAGTYNLGGVRADRGMELQLDRSGVGGRRPEPGVER